MDKIINFPVQDGALLNEFHAGDLVKLNGTIYTARDQAHKLMSDLLENGLPLPFDLKGSAIYYCGPTPPREDGLFGSAGPTTSARMDVFTPPLLKLGLKATIGKGNRNKAVQEACRIYHSVYLITFGGAGAYLAKQIIKQRLIAFPDLGAESIYDLETKDFPAIVGYDCFGGSIF